LDGLLGLGFFGLRLEQKLGRLRLIDEMLDDLRRIRVGGKIARLG
jgi:hypothetical protein